MTVPALMEQKGPLMPLETSTRSKRLNAPDSEHHSPYRTTGTPYCSLPDSGDEGRLVGTEVGPPTLWEPLNIAGVVSVDDRLQRSTLGRL